MKKFLFALLLVLAAVATLHAESKVIIFLKGQVNLDSNTIVLDNKEIDLFEPSIKNTKENKYTAHPLKYYESAYKEIIISTDGAHEISMKSVFTNPLDDSTKNYNTNILNLITEDGKTYFIEVKFGFNDKASLKEIKEKDALKKMDKWEQLKTIVVK